MFLLNIKLIMKNIFKKINNEFFFLEQREELTQFHQKNDCVLIHIDLINYNAEKYHLILSKSKSNLNYIIEERIKEKDNPLDFFLLKSRKISYLEETYNRSKKIILQNGNTLIINHDTPEREFFINNLENLKRIEEAENSVLSYRQKVDDVYLGFSALSYVWKYLFLNKFTNERPSLALEAKRGKNKEIYDVKKLKIENANSTQELEVIEWRFEDITTININEEAQKLIEYPETPAYVIETINKLKGEDGQIHLIKPL